VKFEVLKFRSILKIAQICRFINERGKWERVQSLASKEKITNNGEAFSRYSLLSVEVLSVEVLSAGLGGSSRC
jgi:hypothetical protein